MFTVNNASFISIADENRARTFSPQTIEVPLKQFTLTAGSQQNITLQPMAGGPANRNNNSEQKLSDEKLLIC
jgi:hypothetical protein